MRLVGKVCMSLHMLACGSVVSCVVIVHIVRTRTVAYVRCMDIAQLMQYQCVWNSGRRSTLKLINDSAFDVCTRLWL